MATKRGLWGRTAQRDFAAAGLPEHGFYADAFTSERDKLGV